MGVKNFPAQGGDVVGPNSSTNLNVAVFSGTTGKLLADGGVPVSGGSVTSVSVTTANGVSGTVATATTTPAISLTLGAIVPTTVNGLTITTSTGTLAVTNAKTITFTNTVTLSGTDGVTSTLPSTTGTLINRVQVPYDLACQVTGLPATAAVILNFIAPRAFTLSAAGQQGKALVAATAQADFLVKVNGTTKATLRFAASGTSISVVGGTATTIAAADVITITAPTQDATLSDLCFTLAGVLI